MSITTRTRRGFATAIAAVLATGGVVAMGAAPAQAAAVTTVGDSPITGASMTWSLSDEQGGGAYFGGCNFLSAGTAGNTGSSRLWTEADGFYKTADGNVTVEKPNTSGEYSQPTWATKCQAADGTAVSVGQTSSTTANRVKLSNGVGAVDTATGAGTVTWTGSFTSVFYGGMTYWSAANPKLTVAADGTGTLTATVSGYGTDMDDLSQWVTIAPRVVTLANLANAELDADGFTTTPTYLGTAVNTGDFTPQPAKTSTNQAYWGSFPQTFVDFQKLTGQSSYWYTSGGARDAAKPSTPLSVAGYAISSARPEVTVSETSFDADQNTATIEVSGKNFTPSLAKGTRPPLAGQNAGAYVTFGKFAPFWRPSLDAASTDRKTATAGSGGLKWALPIASHATVGGANAGAIELKDDGTFTTTLTIDKAAIDAIGTAATTNYGIYTYPGSGATMGAYETYTPITFADTTPPVVEPPVVNPPVVEPPVVTPPVAQPAAPARVSVKRGTTKKPTTKKTGKTSLTLKAANGAPVTGKVTVTFKKKGQKTKIKTVTIKNGKGNVTIPKLKKGKWTVSVKYNGTANFVKTATLKRGAFTVVK